MNSWLWKIYYDNGQTYSSDDGSWDDAPLDGVLFVVEVAKGGKVNVLSGNDFYLRIDDTVMATGDMNALLRRFPFIKYGRWVSHRRFEETSEQVRKDCKEFS